MAKMVSLALSKKEAEQEYGISSPGKPPKPDLPRYPYDSRLTLGTEVLEKLGVAPSDFETGQIVTITAKAEIIGTTDEKRREGRDRQEVRLQITDLSMDTKAMKKKKAEDEHLNSISGNTAGETADAED